MGNSGSSPKKKGSGCFAAKDSDDEGAAASAGRRGSSALAQGEHAQSVDTMGGDARERAPPDCKPMPLEFMEQSFLAADLQAIDAVTARTLGMEQLAHLVALRPLFADSPYLRGGRSPDEICNVLRARMCRLGQYRTLTKSAAGASGRACEDTVILTRGEFLTLTWRLLRAPSEKQWEALVYLFHDPGGQGEACLTEEDCAHLLALAANLAVENSCAVVGRRARQAYLSSYRGHLDPASMAKWIAEHELGPRRTAAAVHAWAEEHIPTLGSVVGLRVLMQALEAGGSGTASCLEDARHGVQDAAEQRDGEPTDQAQAHGSDHAADAELHGHASASWLAASVTTEVAARLVPMVDKPSHILSAQALYLLQAWLPASSAQGLKRLYCSKADGHSLNRLAHCITGYKGPSLAIFKDQLERVVAVFNGHEWRDSHTFQGDASGLLLTLAPRFSCLRVLDKTRDRVVPKTNFFYLNTGRGTPLSKARGGAWPVKGMGAGGEPGHLRLAIDENLEGIRWAGGDKACQTFQGGGSDWSPAEGQIDVCEVWGLGGADADEAQEKFRTRQMKMIERARTVDRAAMFGARRADGGWDDHPDKFILDIAGVTNAHSDDYRR